MRTFDDSLMRLGLPADVEAERWVLALVLFRPEDYPKVAALISDYQFSVDAHRFIWGALAHLCESGAHVDTGMVYRELERRGQVAPPITVAYLNQLSDDAPRLAKAEEYAIKVQNCALRREAALELYAAAERLCEPGAEVSQIEQAQSVLQNIGAKAVRPAGVRSIREIIEEPGFMDPHLVEPGISTPWPGVDRLTGGLRQGQLIVWAARPAVGKTTAAVQIGIHAAERGIGVALFSLEMAGQLILRRLLAGRARVDLSAWNHGRLDASERGRLARAMLHVGKLPFSIYDHANATVPAIRAALLRERAKRSIGLVIVDYLQLLGVTRGRASSNRNDEVSEISRGLKVLAMEMGLPVLALSQLTRGNERENRPPRLSDLRDSGAIEQDADIVAFLHRSSEPGSGDMVEFRIEKNRVGMVGKVGLLMEGSRARFSQIGINAEDTDQTAPTEGV
jgi:replicative DNA helicase